MSHDTLKETLSICSVCNKIIPAKYVQVGDEVQLQKSCPQHGSVSATLWRGEPSLLEWAPHWAHAKHYQNGVIDDTRCSARTSMGCVIFHVSERCNLRCTFCFAHRPDAPDIPFEQLVAEMQDIYQQGGRFIHFSGGEPTMRDDLPQLIEVAANIGFEYIQLNTNGLVLAQRPDYAKTLLDAGLSSVFLQFDGMRDDIYQALRGKPLLQEKIAAVDNCSKHGLGVVLVPTLVPGINDDNLGELITFAIDHMPGVKGVHIQPVSYMGYANPNYAHAHITIPEVLRSIEDQTNGLIRCADFAPSVCDSPLCGFHGEFEKRDGELHAKKVQSGGCQQKACVARSQKFVKQHWTRMEGDCFPEGSIDAYLKEVNDVSLSISGMSFMDRDTLDYERIASCESLQVYHNGTLVPFCAHYNQAVPTDIIIK